MLVVCTYTASCVCVLPNGNPMGKEFSGRSKAQIYHELSTILKPFCRILGDLGSILHYPNTSCEAPWEPLGAKRSKSRRLRKRMEEHLGYLGTSQTASERQMFRITAPAHKNKQAPGVPGKVLGSSLEQTVQNHRACAQN